MLTRTVDAEWAISLWNEHMQEHIHRHNQLIAEGCPVEEILGRLYIRALRDAARDLLGPEAIK